ncbi:MAG: type V CRISPR-associated protein Cas12k [Cyanobacteria bacterium P01_H01_bin.15]
MSIITIHCRLTAPEAVRRHLWYLMTERNTPLINDLLKQVSQHPEFETWQRQGTIPVKTIRNICKPLREQYPGQPGRFYASANLMVAYTYESWLAHQKKRRLRLDGKQRWLDIVKSDKELMELSSTTLEVIQAKATEILSHPNCDQRSSFMKRRGKSEKESGTRKIGSLNLMSRLFKSYDVIEDPLNRCAIVYLLKNGGTIPDTPEDPEQYAHRIHRKRKEIEQLEQQLLARLPKGRDLTGEEFLETLAIASQQLPESVTQQKEWQAKLLTRPASLPYPIIYGSSVDLRWGTTEKGRITVNFSGMDKFLKAVDFDLKEWFKSNQDYPFQVYCDQRQLTYFRRFLTDWQSYQASKDTYPAGLMTLCSAMLGWRKGQSKGKPTKEPWTINHLVLYCSFDTQLMSAEGTLQVQQKKLTKASKGLPSKTLEQGFTAEQIKSHRRVASTMTKLKNIPSRPSRKPYSGNSDILVGLSIGLAEPVTVAIVNGYTGTVLTYRTPQTLLGKQYKLLNRQRQRQRQNSLKRHKNQQRGITNQPTESELGEYVDRLLAKSIIQLAQKYQAGSIVIPNVKGLRELLDSEIMAKAEQHCPGAVEVQQAYARNYRQTIHRWSYNRFIKAIHSKAQQLGISIEAGFQPAQGSAKDKAKDIAIAAYHSRAIAIK